MTMLEQLDAALAFHTTGRFELLAVEHIRFAELGADDADAALTRAITGEDGVITVLGISGAGKSSLISSVTERLPPRYLPLRIPAAAATDAFGSIGNFSRHALDRFTRLDLDPLQRRHEAAIQRALADEVKTTHGRSIGVSASIGGGIPILNSRLGGDFKLQSSEELKSIPTDDAALGALQQSLDVLGSAGLVPVLIIEDTDHWAATPEVASQFFDQVVRALSKGPALDAVTIVAVQPVHRDSEGYQVVRELLTLELEVPELRDPTRGLAVLLSSRIDHANVAATASDVFTKSALALMVKAYAEDRSLRRTLSVARSALQQAVSDGVAMIEAGHVQHGMAQYPPTTLVGRPHQT